MGWRAGPLLCKVHTHTLSLRWAGHSCRLINSYWPCSGSEDRASFISEVLTPELQAAGDAPVWLLGDFNFVEAPLLDRAAPHSARTAAADAATTHLVRTLLPSHVDAFRCRHLTGRAYTYHHGQDTFARLDRCYLPPAMAPYVCSAGVVPSPHGAHHAALTVLLPAVPLQPQGPGRRPVSASLTSFEQQAGS